MDDARFDLLTRKRLSRRGIAAGFAGLTPTTLLVAEAKKKKRRSGEISSTQGVFIAANFVATLWELCG